MYPRRKSSENLPSRDIKRKERLIIKIMSDNYEQKLSAEIITGNYHRKLSASIYHHAKNVGIIGILAYPKMLICVSTNNTLILYMRN